MAPGDSGDGLNLSPEERHVYGQLFQQADPDKVGIVMGEVAVKYFEKTRLNSRLLGEIWQIADSENRGFLTAAGFTVALRLIGHAQAGKEPTSALAFSPGPIPRFDGVTVTPYVAPVQGPLSAQGTGTPVGAGVGAPPLVPQGTGATGVRVPPLPLDRAAQYARVFQDQTNGAAVLSGEASKRIFEKSGLGIDILGRIWQLADTEQRGALVQTEFIIAMHLLTSVKSGAMRGVPAVLPAALYDAASRGASGVAPGPVAGMASPSSPGPLQKSPLGASFGMGGIAPPPPAMGRQTTGMRPAPPNFSNSPLGRAAALAPAPAPAPTTGPEWAITPSEKQRMDGVFRGLDKDNKGVVAGDTVVPFLQRSGLDDNILAQIWDLADINSEGQLTSDTFAVALHLIQLQRQNKGPLPDKLPPNLIPPSMRSAVAVPQQRPTSPVAAPVPVPVPKVKSAMDDLFGLDAGPISSTPALTAMPTGPTTTTTTTADPFSGSTPSSPTRVGTSAFKPFVPSSAFGRTLTTQVTGESSSSAPAAMGARAVATPPQNAGFSTPPVPPVPSSVPSSVPGDLLSADDGEASRSLSSDTAELANLSNQIGSLSKHVQETSTNRGNLQAELGQTTTQKRNFEQRLAQLRALYEKEARDVRALEEQLKVAKAETIKVQAEVAAAEAQQRDLAGQQQTVLAQLQADQAENAQLKERLQVVTTELATLRPAVEKLKSEARQQKGIVAINRKQLSLAEADRDKLRTESADLTRETQDLARQIQSASVVSAVSAVSATDTAASGSPSVASASGKNPFFRRTGSSDIMGVFNGPSPSTTPAPGPGSAPAPAPAAGKAFADKSFDDMFGPGAGTSAAASPALSHTAIPASVKPQFTGQSSSSSFSAVTAPTSEQTPAVSRQPTFDAAAEAKPEAKPAAEVKAATATDLSFVVPAAATVAAATTETATSAWSHGKNDSISDPFTTLDETDKVKAKEDFESAFASFKAARAEPAGGFDDAFEIKSPASGTSAGVSAPSAGVSAPDQFASFNAEFPPITELAQDDSDSDSDQGFDDDFAPASPPSAKGSFQSTAAEVNAPTLAAGASASAKSGASTPMLPAVETTSNMDDIFNAPAPEAAATTTTTSTAPMVAFDSSLDDPDDDFAGLEEAHEASGDDEFANVSRSALGEFPSTLSSPAGKAGPFDTGFDFGGLGASTAKAGNDSTDWFSLGDDKAAAAAATVPAAATSSTAPATAPAPTTAPTEPATPDDPTLQRLTSMGYSRAAALGALEKHDYNLELAANYLASQS